MMAENTGLQEKETKGAGGTCKELWQRQKRRNRNVKAFLDENIKKGLKFS